MAARAELPTLPAKPPQAAAAMHLEPERAAASRPRAAEPSVIAAHSVAALNAANAELKPAPPKAGSSPRPLAPPLAAKDSALTSPDPLPSSPPPQNKLELRRER